MIAIDNDSGELVEGNAADHTRKIFQNLKILMQEFELSFDDLVSARIYTTIFDEFPLINACWEEVFTNGQVPPARSAFGVLALPMNAKVEIEFSFYKEPIKN